MPSNYHEISALPAVVPLSTAAFAFMMWRLHRRAAVSVPRIAVAAAWCVYGAGVAANTVFPIYFGTMGDDQSWRVFLNLTPLANTELFDMLTNVLVFVPLGFLLPLVARTISARRVLLFGFLVSFTMEALQFINAVTGHGGHVADVNDLLANSLGAPIGYALFRVVLLLPGASRFADAFTWTPQNEASFVASRGDRQPSESGPDL
ncbi:MAG: VanZ family protein [Aeromicrobium sp.]